MKEIKIFEVRDDMTCMPVLAIKVVNPRLGSREDKLLGKAGWGRDGGVYMICMEMNSVQDDPYKWGDNTRTRTTAHDYIREHFDELEDGAMIDVKAILGEEPMESDIDKREIY